jgi:hypothetical protein
MHFQAGNTYSGKNSLFFEKSSVRFFQKQAVFFRERHALLKMHIYAFSKKYTANLAEAKKSSTFAVQNIKKGQ